MMERYLDTRWAIDKVSGDASLATREKIIKVKMILDEFESQGGIASKDLKSPSDKFYSVLYRYKLAPLVLLFNSGRIKRLKRSLEDWVYRYVVYYLSKDDPYKTCDKKRKKIIFTLVPDHGNLGDLALGYAQKQFMAEKFQDYDLIEIPISRTYQELRNLKKHVSSSDIIVVTGGGDLGTLYPSVEWQRRFVIKKFHNNLIVSFPQSVHFSDDAYGRRQLRISKKIYGKHSNLFLLARDAVSFDFLKQHFNRNRIFLTPDIVLTLDNTNMSSRHARRNAIFSIRRDKESRFNNEQRHLLEGLLSSMHMSVLYRDTSIGDVRVAPGEPRRKELMSIWRAFSRSSIVVTDRLHGMIFCAITNTPCVAVDNRDGKVGNLYRKWLHELNYIKLAKDIEPETIRKELDSLINPRGELDKFTSLNRSFDEFEKALTTALGDHVKSK